MTKRKRVEVIDTNDNGEMNVEQESSGDDGKEDEAGDKEDSKGR